MHFFASQSGSWRHVYFKFPLPMLTCLSPDQSRLPMFETLRIELWDNSAVHAFGCVISPPASAWLGVTDHPLEPRSWHEHRMSNVFNFEWSEVAWESSRLGLKATAFYICPAFASSPCSPESIVTSQHPWMLRKDWQ